MRSGYISEAVVVGLTSCGDLRDSILIGQTVGREPNLRGGEVRAAGPFGRLPWEVKKPFSLDLLKEVQKKSGRLAPADIKVALLEVPMSSDTAAESLSRVGVAPTRIGPDASLNELKKYDVLFFPAGWSARTELVESRERLQRYVEQGGSIFFSRPDRSRASREKSAVEILPFSVKVEGPPAFKGMTMVRVIGEGSPHPLSGALRPRTAVCL